MPDNGKEKASAEAGQSSLSSYVEGIFESFKTARKPFEAIWEECWYNFLGQYQESARWKKTEGTATRSRIFIRLTTVKCHTAHSKIMDVYGGKVPFDMEPVLEKADIPVDVAKDIVSKRKRRLEEHFKAIELEEILDAATLERAILGTAVLKGPIVETRRKPVVSMRQIGGVPVREIDPEMSAYEIRHEEEITATIDHVPLWEYYVDPNARSPKESIAEIQFKRMLPAQFRQLAYSGGYVAENVFEAARRATTTDASDETRRVQLADNFMGEQGEKDERVSVLEYWGLVPVSMLKDAGCDVPADVVEEDSIEAVVVIAADGIVVKACINPLGRRPFYVAPWKRRPHCIYGEGPAESMRDSQKMINSSARMIIDNKALSGNGMVGVNLDRINTKRTKDLTVYPSKTWYIKGNYAPREAIDAIQFPDVTHGLRELMEMFERFADEETGIPKYSSGQEGSFLNKTATGMSMLMTQANVNLKTAMKNADDNWIEPIVEALDAWFAEFVYPEELRIPCKVKARGTDSLIAKEIKLESIMKFMQITSSPQDAVFQDRVKMMKEVSRILDVGDFMRSDEEIKGIMQQMTSMANTPKNLREQVDLDKLYPYLSRSEQMQILQELGIQPDVNYNPPQPPLTNKFIGKKT